MAFGITNEGLATVDSQGITDFFESHTGVTTQTSLAPSKMLRVAVLGGTSDILRTRSFAISGIQPYYTVHFQLASLVGTNDFLHGESAAGGQDWSFGVLSTGALRILDSTGTQVGVSTSGIVEDDTWYTLHLWYQQSNTGAMKLWIDKMDSPDSYTSPSILFTLGGKDFMSAGGGDVNLRIQNSEIVVLYIADVCQFRDLTTGGSPHSDIPVGEYRAILTYGSDNTGTTQDWGADALDGGTWADIEDVPINTANQATYTAGVGVNHQGGITCTDATTGGPLARPTAFDNVNAAATWAFWASRASGGIGGAEFWSRQGGHAVETTENTSQVNHGDPGTSVTQFHVDSSLIGDFPSSFVPDITENLQIGFRAVRISGGDRAVHLHEALALIMHVEKRSTRRIIRRGTMSTVSA